MQERRRYKRIPFKEAVHFDLSQVENIQSIYGGCLSCDLSEGGIRLYFNEFLPKKSPVQVDFVLKNDEVVNIGSQVVWIQKIPHAEYYQVGLEFIHTKESLLPKSILKGYIDGSMVR